MAGILEKVKYSLGITGNYQDTTLKEYIDEVAAYMVDAGVSEAVANSEVSAGVIARGVSDLWNYGGGKLSEYFYQRVGQLVYAEKCGKYITFNAGDYGLSYPVNIEGLEIAETDTVVFSCKINSETTITKNYTGNPILITFTQEESALFSSGTYYWELKVHKNSAVITAVNDGVLIVS